VASASARGHSRKAAHELPAGAARTLDEARHYFMDHQLDKAEDKYLEVLKLDEKNIVVLADLASIEMELNKLDLAEQHINAALAVDANDDYNLFVLGQIKFREGKYDDAFAALSQAAQINPQNAKVQNFLGLTLSEKGMRGPAETAFRKAIQFDPDFAQAHMNLAVVYITQTPPLAELAKWHYQKAISAGAPPKPDLEKLINGGKTAEPAH
jgi:Flp pilus assembly protein TadD